LLNQSIAEKSLKHEYKAEGENAENADSDIQTEGGD
jgi:hypothetical protein